MALSNLGKFVVGSAIVSLLVGVITYVVTRESGPQMTPLMQQLTRTTTHDFAQRIPRYRNVETIYLIVHGRGSRTPELEFQGELRQAVASTDKYRVTEWKDIESFLQKEQNKSLWKRLVNKVLGDEQGNVTEPSSVEAAGEVIKQLDNANYQPEIDGVLVVDVTDFYEGPDEDGLGAKVGVTAELWSKRENKVVASMEKIQHSIESPWDRRYLNHRMKQQSFILRFLLWFIVGCGLPWALIQVVRAVLRRRNNGATVGLLAAFVLADLVVAWILLFAFGLGWGTAIGLLVVAGLMGYYNYDAVEYINRRLL
ncbi:MAG: hypothetical protein AB7N76_16960 [Planctomycetota bacterium]